MKINSKKAPMAGEQNSYLRFRVPQKVKDDFEAACAARGADMSKMARLLLEAFNRAHEAGEPLVAPLAVVSGTKEKP